jgi:choline kinase
VVLVRNPDFRTTNTAQSLCLGAQHLPGKILYLDGDLILEPVSLRNFLTAAAKVPQLVGITDAKSENAVFTEVHASATGPVITRFSRDACFPLEWANVFSGDKNLMRGATGYVFERLAQHLPLPAQVLCLAEVDTSADLEAATRFVAGLLPVGSSAEAE